MSPMSEVKQHKMGKQKVFENKTAEQIREECKPHKVFELGNGLEMWLVDIALLQEQSVNARSMAPDTFNQLSDNIRRRGALESTPLCALTEKGLEIVSGHHRVRAARKAEIERIWVLVDVSELSRDAIKAKQLAHNSLQGQDNEDLVRQIFESIQDVDARIEAFIEPDLSDLAESAKLAAKSLEVMFDSKVATIMFLPAQFDVFKQALGLLTDETDELFLATRDEYETMVAATAKVSEAYEITSTPTLFAKMAEIVIEHAEQKLEEKAEAEEDK